MRLRGNRKHRVTGGSSCPISACPDPKPAPVTTGDNNKTVANIMTFIKCITEGQAVGYMDNIIFTFKHRVAASPHTKQRSFEAFQSVYSTKC